MRKDILDPLRDLSQTAPQKIALRSHDRADTSVSQLLQIIDTVHAHFVEHGVEPGSRIATILPNRPETAVAILAVASFATSVPLNPAYALDETKRLLVQSGVTHLITDTTIMADATAAAIALDIPILQLVPLAGPTGAFRLAPHKPQRRTVAADTPDAGLRSSTALVLQTSGSTGTPKRVPLSAENLISSAWNVARSIELGPADICLNMMPMFHIGALVDLLLAPLYAGGSTAFAGGISSEAFFRGLQHFHPTWSQAVPTVLRDLLAHGATGEDARLFRDLRFIRAVSQPLPTRLQEEFEDKFGTRLVPMFGMTETAGLITSTPLDRLRLKPGSVGVPFGPQVMICDSLGNEVTAGKRGEVLISGPSVMSAYEGDAAVSRDTFRGDWLCSGDEGFIDDEGFLFLTGRLKDIINRGGEKISPQEIDMILSDHPNIAEAAAFAMPHPSLGEEVAVAVVPRDRTTLETSDIIDHLRGRTANFKIPRTVIFLDKLPRVPSGKLDRRALPELAGATVQARSHIAPASPLAKTLAAMWTSVLKVPVIGMEDNFFDLGGDSLSATNLALLLEERFGRDIPVSALFDAPTLREMEQVLSARVSCESAKRRLAPEIYSAVRLATAAWRGKRRDDSLVLGRNTFGKKRAFFWVCQSMWQFECLSEGLDPDRPFYILSSLSNTRVKSDENTQKLARYYVSEILGIQPEGPYLIGGFCQGGVVAFEIATMLKASGHAVSLLCLQDRFVAKPYDGELALFWGKRGWFCAYDLNDQPERAWAKYYSGPISVFYSSADHDDLHKPPYVDDFTQQLEKEFERVELSQPSANSRLLQPMKRLDRRCFASTIRAQVPTFMRQGSRRSIKVAITNTSPVPWEPTEKSGIILATRWRSLDKSHGYALDARLPLGKEIKPSATAIMELQIKVPMRNLPMFLDIDLVEDGICWFGGAGRSGLRRLVIPLAPDWRS
ncbi:putative Coenzyme a synthetase-like protein [Pseudorhizobium banfieldiae]|uniref:Putative Coenzyme a synthetase-like protein n=1 Tax=Pseudorhizobium banfieldiae TaxID=1125847 RepID=L0NBN6_9HYPH|nr:AMP-binding protein [Pseudorhizobium banfieldiae]CAD6601831.1 AMP-dependent synthetase [arsenite-oxidising bacterium NT-25]CCF18294.1 putative Coenzyme a synthetase-like protein [Pseudorhizobium banfieldiae]